MGKSQSREEIIIAQTASGGSNSSSLEELKYHTSFSTRILGVICLILMLAVLYFTYRLYGKCHRRWIQREIQENNFRRTGSWFWRREMRDGRGDVNENREDRAGVRIV